MYRFATSVALKIFTNSPYKQLGKRSDKLAMSIAENYIGFVKISKSLENEYGFKVFNFMQPNIYSKKNLTETEKGYYKDYEYYKNLFIDISDVFDAEEKTIYVDFCHTGEPGNQLVAKKMFTYLKSVLRTKTIETTEELKEN